MKNPKTKSAEKRPSPNHSILKIPDLQKANLTRWAGKSAFTLEEAVRLSVGIDPDGIETPGRVFKMNPDTDKIEILDEVKLDMITMRMGLESLFRREMKARAEEVPPHIPNPNNFPDLPPIPGNFRISREKIKAHLESIGQEPPFFFQEREKQPVQQKEAEPLKNEQFVFKNTGTGWLIVFDGKTIAPLRGKGFEYMHYCVEQWKIGKGPRKFTCIELEKAIKVGMPTNQDRIPIDLEYEESEAKIPSGFQFGSAGELEGRQEKTDPDTLRRAQNSLREVMEDLAEAEANNDIGRAETLREQKEKIEDYLEECERKGVLEPFRNEETKISDKVTRAISRALDTLRDQDEEVYKHFHEAFKPIRSPSKQYKPTQNLDWILN